MGQVNVILQEDVTNLGHAGDVVSVKPGYARNYLLPKGIAAAASAARVKELDHHKRAISEKQAKLLKDLKGVQSRLNEVHLEITAQAGAEGKLFGSVTAQNIADLLRERGFEIDRRKIGLRESIKTVGEHKVPIKLHRDLPVAVTVTVAPPGGVIPSAADVAAAEETAFDHIPETEERDDRDDDD